MQKSLNRIAPQSSRGDHARYRIVLASAVVAAMAWSTMPAYAYLDPGSVSFVLQGVVGGVAATTAVIGGYWSKIKWFFSSRDRVTPSKHDGQD